MSDAIADAAFETYLENMGEDDGDDLLSLAEISFYAGWDACHAWMTRPENAREGEGDSD